MMLPQLLEAQLQKQLPAALEMLREMVNINSFTRNKAGVNELGHMTAIAFATLGFRAAFVPAQNEAFGHHVVLTRRGRGSHAIGLVAHLDTVYPPEEERANQFYWREEVHGNHTRLYGPGTVDIKGGTVLMHLMLETLHLVMPEFFDEVTWVILLNAAEEDFVSDFHHLCRTHLLPEQTIAGLVFEGGYVGQRDMNVVVARKGMARYQITVEGRAAHAGAAHAQGANAIVQMADVVQKVAALTDYNRALTFNVGTFRGGTVVNRVPHCAEVELEFRTFAHDTFHEAIAQMEQLNHYATVRSVADGYACHTSVNQTHRHDPWPRNRQTDSLFTVWQKIGRSLGYEVHPEERGGLSDGNPLWSHIPTLDGLGPAGGNAHCSERTADGVKDQEYAVKESFVPKALLNLLSILELVKNR